MTIEEKKRSILKSITWRVCATTTTILLVLIFTGDLSLSIVVGSLEVIAKFIIYYIHERAWNATNWGVEEY